MSGALAARSFEEMGSYMLCLLERGSGTWTPAKSLAGPDIDTKPEPDHCRGAVVRGERTSARAVARSLDASGSSPFKPIRAVWCDLDQVPDMPMIVPSPAWVAWGKMGT